MIWYDMICYDMIWYDDTIWYDMMIWYDIWYDMMWCDVMWYMIWYDMIWYDMIWCDVMWCDVMWCDMWCDIWYEMIWCDVIYDMIWNDTIYLTAIGLPPGGSSTVHIYTKIHRTTQNKQNIDNTKLLEECRPCPIFASYTLVFALQLTKKHAKTLVRVVGNISQGK